ncbi:MAG: hypothetical protein FWG90_12505 [Oscillospiraceae bacterium]|nr:hypothetical protein [Oscillospiraceae bacterium]
MKKLLFIFIALLIISLFPISTSAHDYENPHKCGYSYGYDSESKYSTNWDIFEGSTHWSNHEQTITVSHGDFSDSNHVFHQYISNAITTWDSQTFNGSKLLSMEASDEGSVIFLNKTERQIKDSFRFENAAWGVMNGRDSKYDKVTGHYSTDPGSVEIWVWWSGIKGKSDNAKKHVALHELGHVIGLADIPSYKNDYLMCNGFKDKPAPTTITLADKQGAAVISGQHKDHDFNYPEKEITETTHDKVCTICGVYKEKEAHKWDLISWTKCTECGHARDAAPPREIAVVNRNGVPIKGVYVGIRSEANGSTSRYTDENGIFPVDWLDDSCTLKLQHGNYKPQTIDNVEVKDGNASIEGQALAVIVMDLLDRIRVVDTDGNPIKNARVDFTGHSGIRSGEDGFLFINWSGWDDGDYALTATQNIHITKRLNFQIKDKTFLFKGKPFTEIVMKPINLNGEGCELIVVEKSTNGDRTVSVYSGELGFVEGLVRSANGIQSMHFPIFDKNKEAKKIESRYNANGELLWEREYPSDDTIAFMSFNPSVDNYMLVGDWRYIDADGKQTFFYPDGILPPTTLPADKEIRSITSLMTEKYNRFLKYEPTVKPTE